MVSPASDMTFVPVIIFSLKVLQNVQYLNRVVHCPTGPMVRIAGKVLQTDSCTGNSAGSDYIAVTFRYPCSLNHNPCSDYLNWVYCPVLNNFDLVDGQVRKAWWMAVPEMAGKVSQRVLKVW